MSEILRQALRDGEEAGRRYALRLPRQLPAGTAGPQQGASAGSSLEFREHREYEPGDDLRHIDWNVYARSDQLVVKRYHSEIMPHLDLVLDVSRSMALEGSPKAEAALGLAAFFTAAAEEAGMRHCVWLAQEGCALLDQSQQRPSAWQLPDFSFAGSPADAFARRPPKFRERGLRILISDLLWLGDPLAVLGPCIENATSVTVVQLLAAADAAPPERGNLRLFDSETNRWIDVRVDAPAIARYQATLTRHRELWHGACRRIGSVFVGAIAEDVRRDWRIDELLVANVLQAT